MPARAGWSSSAGGGWRADQLRGAGALAGLTRREREIVQLAAAGRSSHQIARTLRLSPRTVDNHPGRAYAKLGVSGRHTFGRLDADP